MRKVVVVVGLALAWMTGCEASPARPPRDSPIVSGRLAAGSEAIARDYGDAKVVQLRGLVEDVVAYPNSPRGRGTVRNGTRVIIVDDSHQDWFPSVPGSRDVAVMLKSGGLDGKAVFIARPDLRPATKPARPKESGSPPGG